MGLLGWIFGWEWKVRRLRKKWDRLREKSLKKEEPARHIALEKLDKAEEHLRMLEERRLSRWDRARFIKELEIDLEEIKAILEAKPGEIAPQQKYVKSK